MVVIIMLVVEEDAVREEGEEAGGMTGSEGVCQWWWRPLHTLFLLLSVLVFVLKSMFLECPSILSLHVGFCAG